MNLNADVPPPGGPAEPRVPKRARTPPPTVPSFAMDASPPRALPVPLPNNAISLVDDDDDDDDEDNDDIVIVNETSASPAAPTPVPVPFLDPDPPPGPGPQLPEPFPNPDYTPASTDEVPTPPDRHDDHHIPPDLLDLLEAHFVRGDGTAGLAIVDRYLRPPRSRATESITPPILPISPRSFPVQPPHRSPTTLLPQQPALPPDLPHQLPLPSPLRPDAPPDPHDLQRSSVSPASPRPPGQADANELAENQMPQEEERPVVVTPDQEDEPPRSFPQPRAAPAPQPPRVPSPRPPPPPRDWSQGARKGSTVTRRKEIENWLVVHLLGVKGTTRQRIKRNSGVTELIVKQNPPKPANIIVTGLQTQVLAAIAEINRVLETARRQERFKNGQGSAPDDPTTEAANSELDRGTLDGYTSSSEDRDSDQDPPYPRNDFRPESPPRYHNPSSTSPPGSPDRRIDVDPPQPRQPERAEPNPRRYVKAESRERYRSQEPRHGRRDILDDHRGQKEREIARERERDRAQGAYPSWENNLPGRDRHELKRKRDVPQYRPRSPSPPPLYARRDSPSRFDDDSPTDRYYMPSADERRRAARERFGRDYYAQERQGPSRSSVPRGSYVDPGRSVPRPGYREQPTWERLDRRPVRDEPVDYREPRERMPPPVSRRRNGEPPRAKVSREERREQNLLALRQARERLAREDPEPLILPVPPRRPDFSWRPPRDEVDDGF